MGHALWLDRLAGGIDMEMEFLILFILQEKLIILVFIPESIRTVSGLLKIRYFNAF